MPRLQARVGVLFAGFVLLLALASARSIYLGAFQAGKLRRAAVSQQVATVAVPALRGTIFDRNGVELAVSEPADDISATPYLVRDPAAAARKLAPILGAQTDAVAAKLTRRTGFVYLARGLPDASAQQIAKLRLSGIALTPLGRRDYPNHALSAHVIGAVGLDGAGLSGLEYSQERMLRGKDGQRRSVNDALGNPISTADLRTARAGAPVRLTLDAGLQGQVEQVLSRIGAVWRPKGATAIVMDPHSGGILAMANWPRVDANDIAAAPAYARQNRAVGFDYEPGSTFKVVAIGGALQDGLLTPQTSFDLPPQIQVADRTIHDAEARGPVTYTTSQILSRSSNIGAIKVGMLLGRRRFDQYVRDFGFGAATHVDLPGEERGLVLSLDHYSGSSMGNLPIGQGESVTPLQIASAYSAIANGGVLPPPHIVASVDGRASRQPAGRRVFSPVVSQELRTMLRGVLAPGGTASEVSIPGYKLAGKTGTANKVDPSTGQYSSSRYVASFVGFAPAQNPKLLVSVVVDEPQGAIYGGQVAAPAFGQIMSFALPYLMIPPG
ncbi:MAG: peptidoglycan D,D-transpeptidase FtsI family protein [Solirubrobacteraceae bacterium]